MTKHRPKSVEEIYSLEPSYSAVIRKLLKTLNTPIRHGTCVEFDRLCELAADGG